MSDMAEEFSPRPAPAARQTRLFYDPASYSAFPHVIRMEGDELLVAFRQAPKVEGIRHTHPRSIITLIRSYDLGESWQIDAASQMGAGGGQELGLIYLGVRQGRRRAGRARGRPLARNRADLLP